MRIGPAIAATRAPFKRCPCYAQCRIPQLFCGPWILGSKKGARGMHIGEKVLVVSEKLTTGTFCKIGRTEAMRWRRGGGRDRRSGTVLPRAPLKVLVVSTLEKGAHGMAITPKTQGAYREHLLKKSVVHDASTFSFFPRAIGIPRAHFSDRSHTGTFAQYAYHEHLFNRCSW